MCGRGAQGVGCTDIAITWDDSQQITSTSISSQIYAKYLKKVFYYDVKYDLWQVSPEKYLDMNHVLVGGGSERVKECPTPRPLSNSLILATTLPPNFPLALFYITDSFGKSISSNSLTWLSGGPCCC